MIRQKDRPKSIDRRTMIRLAAGAASAAGLLGAAVAQTAAMVHPAEKRATMLFDNQCRIQNDPEGEGLRLIRQAGAPRFP